EVVPHVDHPTLHERLTVIRHASETGASFPGKGMVAAAGHPNHDRQLRGRKITRPPDIQGEAVLASDHLAADDLRTDRPEITGSPDSLPGHCFDGRPPAQRTNGSLRIRNALEGEGTPFACSTDRARNGTDDIGIGGGAFRSASGARAEDA